MKIRRNRKEKDFPVYRLDPSERLCPYVDDTSVALFPVADPGDMGIRVVDNFPEEHIQ